MTYENISKAVGFPVNTVKTWVRRSKDFLNRCMRGLH
jgi:DNA-directed RNA polymerase specialized sigma24 family protein